jgi:hypothetical protein
MRPGFLKHSVILSSIMFTRIKPKWENLDPIHQLEKSPKPQVGGWKSDFNALYCRLNTNWWRERLDTGSFPATLGSAGLVYQDGAKL